MNYKARNIEDRIEALLRFFPVIIILGVRQCGKTTLARKLRPDWGYYDLERYRDYDLITGDFDLFIREHPQAIIIDEAQRFPELFQELRAVIDQDRQQKGRFILTGSSSLDLMKRVSESLAGRVGIIELGTFKLNELHDHRLPEFYSIFKEPITHTTTDHLKRIKTAVSHDELMDFFLRGGYPEPALSGDDHFIRAWMDNYYQTYIQRDIRSIFPRLDLVRYQRFITMLSSLSGTVINRSQVARSLDVSEKSVRDYLDIAAGSYIWRNVFSYGGSRSKSIVKMPRGSFRDSGLSHFIQGVYKRDQLAGHPTVGAAFEAFVMEEIIKGVQATAPIGFNYYYFRTRNGAEVDLILKGDFGILPIEIKFGSHTEKRRLRSLISFVENNHLPLGIVINNSDRIQMIADKIIQIPATCI